MPKPEADYVRFLDRVRPEMMLDSFWLRGCDERPVMSEDAIAAFNRSLHMCMPFDENLSFSLDDAPDTLPGNVLRRMINIYVPPEDPAAWFVRSLPTDRAYWNRLLQNRALDRIPDTVPVRFGYSVRRGMIEMFPTDDYMGEDAQDRFFDMNTASECLPYLPLVVLHESLDGRWLFCVFYNIGGWVRRENVAACGDREDWMRRRNSARFLTVTGRELRLRDDPYCESLSGLLLPMGTRLPLLRADEAPSEIHGRGVYGNYVTLLPVRGRDGMIADEYSLIPLSDDVCVGTLPYTSANVIRQAFKLLGDIYGWGGAMHANDCSGIVHEIYTCFGFLLPRGGKSEADVPCIGRVDVSGYTAEQKKKLLAGMMPGSLLYLPGHIVIYLGMADGEPYAISATGSMGLSGMAEGEVKKILSVCVNDLSVRRRTGRTWLESMTVFLTLK